MTSSSMITEKTGFQEVLRTRPELWDHYTRAEEYTPNNLDSYGRFPGSASSCRRISQPIASEALFKTDLLPSWPEEHEFAVCLTHDIDSVYRPRRAQGAEAIIKLLRKDVHGFWGDLKKSACMGKRWPLCDFERILDLEEEYGASSSFFFLVQDPDEDDYTYEIEDLEAEMGHIRDRSGEIGLHGGFSCYHNLEQVRQRKTRLAKAINAPVVGYRNHYLLIKVPKTWELLAHAGFLYDTTLGYHDCIGFRNGMCHPFRPFNRHSDSEIPLIEVPLIISDMALFNYMHLDIEAAWIQIQQMIDRVCAVRGVVTILWHNISMFDERLDLYRRILNYCREKNAWMDTCGELVKWWTSQ